MTEGNLLDHSVLRCALAAYKVVLRAYPRDFREKFEAEMVEVFGDCLRDLANAVHVRVFVLLVRSILDVVSTALPLRIAAFVVAGDTPRSDRLSHVVRVSAITLVATAGCNLFFWTVIAHLLPRFQPSAVTTRIPAEFWTILAPSLGVVVVALLLALHLARSLAQIYRMDCQIGGRRSSFSQSRSCVNPHLSILTGGNIHG